MADNARQIESRKNRNNTPDQEKLGAEWERTKRIKEARDEFQAAWNAWDLSQELKDLGFSKSDLLGSIDFQGNFAFSIQQEDLELSESDFADLLDKEMSRAFCE